MKIKWKENSVITKCTEAMRGSAIRSGTTTHFYLILIWFELKIKRNYVWIVVFSLWICVLEISFNRLEVLLWPKVQYKWCGHKIIYVFKMPVRLYACECMSLSSFFYVNELTAEIDEMKIFNADHFKRPNLNQCHGSSFAYIVQLLIIIWR